MENIIFFVAFTIFYGKEVSAQDYFREPSVKIGNTLLICKKNIDVYRIHNATNDTTPFRWTEGTNFFNIQLKSQREFHNVFGEVFSLGRLKELSESDKKLRVNFYVNNIGALYQISFSIPVDSKIKPSELVKLDSLMKQRFRYTKDEFERTGSEKVVISYPVPFEKIISGEKIFFWNEWEYP